MSGVPFVWMTEHLAEGREQVSEGRQVHVSVSLYVGVWICEVLHATLSSL